MNIDDAREILTVLLNKEFDDSLLIRYEVNERNYNEVIEQLKLQITDMESKSNNQESQKQLLLAMIDNKTNEINLLEKTIKAQKKEIRKQKFLKVIGFSGVIALPIIAILLK